MLDIIAANNFERPLYFATTVGSENFLGLDPYFRLEGFTYKLMPVKTGNTDKYATGTVNSEVLFDRMFNKLIFEKKIYQEKPLSENKLNTIATYRSMFTRLANQLTAETNSEKALKVVDFCMELFPENVARYDYHMLDFIGCYFKNGQTEKAKSLLISYMKSTINEIEALKKSKEKDNYNLQLQVYILSEMLRISQEFLTDDQITKDLQAKFEEYQTLMN
jgi:hypothetical protein